MNILENTIWDYLDGKCSNNERVLIEDRVQNDPQFRNLFEEIRHLHKGLSDMESEQPSMSFQRNLMERINLEPNPSSIATLINKKIIYGIGLFFLISISLLLGYVLSNQNWTEAFSNQDKLLNLPKLSFNTETASILVKLFLFADLLAVLYLFDVILNKRLNSKKN